MIAKLNQLLKFIKIKFKIHHKYFLMWTVFSYFFVFLLSLILPTILSQFEFYKYLKDGSILFVGIVSLIYFLNILLISPKYISRIIDSKSKYYLMPFNINIKIVGLFLLNFVWIGVNFLIYKSIIYLYQFLNFSKDLENILSNSSRININISDLLFMLFFTGAIITFQIIKRKKTKFFNFFIGLIILISVGLVFYFVTESIVEIDVMKKVSHDLSGIISFSILSLIYIPASFFIGNKQNMRL